MRKISYNDTFWNEESKEMSYGRRKDDRKTAVHHGQRKLLLTEIYFLSLVDPPPGSTIVYIGAAGGEHIPLLVSLFPDFIYHLYDAKSYHRKVVELAAKNDNLIIRPEGNFTNELAQEYVGMENIYVMSDIRIVDSSVSLQYANTAHSMFKKDYERLSPDQKTKVEEVVNNVVGDYVKDDMDFQNKWVQIMQPVAAYLKFRLPYTDGVTETFTSYPEGKVYFQPWTGPTSTEARLLCYPPYDTVEYSDLRYERVMSYHNRERENNELFVNIFNGTATPQDPGTILGGNYELGNDYDSTLEAYILLCYLRLIKDKKEPYEDDVLALSRRFTIGLMHGKYSSLSEFRKDNAHSGRIRLDNERRRMVRRGDKTTFSGNMLTKQYSNLPEGNESSFDPRTRETERRERRYDSTVSDVPVKNIERMEKNDHRHDSRMESSSRSKEKLDKNLSKRTSSKGTSSNKAFYNSGKLPPPDKWKKKVVNDSDSGSGSDSGTDSNSGTDSD